MVRKRDESDERIENNINVRWKVLPTAVSIYMS